MKPDHSRKPKAVLLSKRANAFYLEHVRVMQKDGSIIWINDRHGDIGSELEPYFNLPERNTVFVLLGKGSSITDAAARRLADAGVMVGFTGSGGSPLFSSVDPVFLTPQSEYRPTQYFQAWVKSWFDDGARLRIAKSFLRKRAEITLDVWSGDANLSERAVILDDALLRWFLSSIESAKDTQSLLLVEARWAKTLYRKLAEGHKLSDFRRNEGKGRSESRSDLINGLIDHGNYVVYGYAAAVLYTMGISYAFPVLHGKTRRGALVFDLADLTKDAYVLPLAFQTGIANARDQEFRNTLIETFQAKRLMDMMFDFMKTQCN